MDISKYLFLKRKTEPPQVLTCGLDKMDHWLGSRFHFGQMVEWGMPRGYGSRLFITQFLRRHAGLSVWIYNPEEKKPYPPTWAAWGVNLEKTYFIGSKKPVKDLKALFLDTVFRLIVIDSIKLSPGDISFLASRARMQKQLILVLQPYLLSTKSGNALMSLRLNGLLKVNHYHFWPVRGSLTRSLKIEKNEIWNVIST